jgi:hypothetical protein
MEGKGKAPRQFTESQGTYARQETSARQGKAPMQGKTKQGTYARQAKTLRKARQGT